MLLAFYALALTALALHAPAAIWSPEARAFLVVIGTVGAWRWSWGFVHLARSLWYRRRVFARWRRAVERLAAHAADDTGRLRLLGPEAFVVVTSYRIRSETTAAMLRAAVAEAIDCGLRVTIVVSLVEPADARLVKALFHALTPPERVSLALVRLDPRGKRGALAVALRAVSRLRPHPEAGVVVMDGDTVLPPGTLRRCLPFFTLLPKVMGLTTDQDAVVAGGPLITAWHRLRFAQRHLVMSSVALSGRLLTMTGRMAIFRARVATHPGFIRRIEDDALDHWRLGRVPLLTGEDKSTWLWLLQNRCRMLYVPDVRVLTIEHPPSPSFVKASTSLMLRWFGNMLRAGSQALALGPARTGGFLWWCLIDQRLSMWTPLVGPTAALLVGFTGAPAFLYAYGLWVLATRLGQTLLLLTVRDTVSGLWPFLLYYNQVYGALVKTWVLFRPDRQRWTRQNIRLGPAGRGRAWVASLVSGYLHVLALAALVTGVGFATGALTLSPGRLLGDLF